MARIKKPRDVKGAGDLKILEKTTTSVLQSRIPPRSAANMKHCHTLTTNRQVRRIDRRTWEARVADILQLAESHRYNRVNALHHTLQNVQILLREVSSREKALKSTSEELKQTTNYLQTIMDSMADVLIATDLNGMVTEVNLAAEKQTSFSRAELIGHPFYSLFVEHDAAREGLKGVLKEKVLTDRELSLICKDAHVIPVLYSATLLEDENSTVTGILISARDITEIKKAQEARERFAEELARANADLEEFASVASHDLEEPLKKLMASASGLQSRYEDALDQDAKRELQEVVSQAGYMRGFIRSVLDYAKVDSGVSAFAVTNVEEVLQQAFTNLAAAIEESGAIITHDPLPTVSAIETQLVRVFQNIIGNAIKYRDVQREEGCHIHVSAERLEQSTVVTPSIADKQGWLFSIKDNGIGIDPEFTEDIFEMFTRLHREGEYSGSGVGLAISRKIVKRHNGRIWAVSQVGKGSIFYFTLADNPA